MSEPKRRFLELTSLQGSSAPTLVPADTLIEGNVTGRGQFVIAGEVRGDGALDGSLHLAVTAHWIGNIRAHQAVIAGKIEGSLVVADTLEIGLTAVIRGRVSARNIAIARGAIVDGEIEITSGDPIIQFDERRRGR